MYDTVPPSRRYLTVTSALISFALGFYLWQLILNTGLNLAHPNTLDGSDAAPNIFIKSLAWGSPLYAMCIGGLFWAAIWGLSSFLGFSHHRRVKQLRLGASAFIAGLLISFFGIMADFADKPPLDMVYQPILEAFGL